MGRSPQPGHGGGYAVPEDGAPSGHGLWVANQFSDVVDVASGPGGTDVRLYFRLPHAAV